MRMCWPGDGSLLFFQEIKDERRKDGSATGSIATHMCVQLESVIIENEAIRASERSYKHYVFIANKSVSLPNLSPNDLYSVSKKKSS